MVPEIHKIKVNTTLLVHSQFGVPEEKTVIQNGKQTNLYFRYNGNEYQFSKTNFREKTPHIRVFYFTPELRKFNLENPHLEEGTFIDIEIFTK
jgi:hypothetical protein